MTPDFHRVSLLPNHYPKPAVAYEPKWPMHPTTVFVSGLGSDATDESLKARFEPSCGTVHVARLLRDKKTGASKVLGWFRKRFRCFTVMNR